VIVIGAIAGFAYFSTKGAVDATRAMMEDVKKGDLDKAYGG